MHVQFLNLVRVEAIVRLRRTRRVVSIYTFLSRIPVRLVRLSRRESVSGPLGRLGLQVVRFLMALSLDVVNVETRMSIFHLN